jgi:hypothetical protein
VCELREASAGSSSERQEGHALPALPGEIREGEGMSTLDFSLCVSNAFFIIAAFLFEHELKKERRRNLNREILRKYRG